MYLKNSIYHKNAGMGVKKLLIGKSHTLMTDDRCPSLAECHLSRVPVIPDSNTEMLRCGEPPIKQTPLR